MKIYAGELTVTPRHTDTPTGSRTGQTIPEEQDSDRRSTGNGKGHD